ncbi:VOC family protein [Cryptosporangium phraense]|uniref:(2,3-dihydroxybenzoyl)adenylate synthase n=1 Tax=Cryptosporangium phraense TaxID=2593070 RepID=A0A545AJS4_9ACTN|nr:VOC family protein [Cryptosporangium phraense]TQS40975.1 (2,3-dihydroxybenzoyl)adenylate synthase [Cryptosporangium phraense]
MSLSAICFAALHPERQERFWAELLGPNPGFTTKFERTTTLKTSQNRAHFDLTSTSLDDQRETVARALRLGARHVDVGQRPEEGHVVLADPEGNEFCVIEPGNQFLAGCGFIGALACDGSRQVGEFWSAALGWPLVWDQGEETAIQSPQGGPKISWGGPPLMPRTGPDRIWFELSSADVGWLLSLGATRVEGSDRLADPDGNVFRVLPG